MRSFSSLVSGLCASASESSTAFLVEPLAFKPRSPKYFCAKKININSPMSIPIAAAPKPNL